MNRQILITLMRIAFVVLFLALVETARAETPVTHVSTNMTLSDK